MVDGLLVFFDFKKGGYASKMRRVVDEDQISKQPFYEELELKVSENVAAH